MTLTQLQATGQPFPTGEADVQRTSFSLDVPGRFICSTYDEATTNPDFDVVVIGSGMYGSYAAAKIYSESAKPGRTSLRVLVLEAGPFLVHEHGQNIPDLGLGNPFRPVTDPFGPDAQRTRDLVWGIGWRSNVGFPGTAYCAGGKSIYWGGWCPRLRDADLAQWPKEVGAYLNGPPDFGNLPNRHPLAGEQTVYQAVEFEIGSSSSPWLHSLRRWSLRETRRGSLAADRGDAAAVEHRRLAGAHFGVDAFADHHLLHCVQRLGQVGAPAKWAWGTRPVPKPVA